ncbi:MAG: alpha/beta hydrolase-fold protein [Pseudomonadota bacterium]
MTIAQDPQDFPMALPGSGRVHARVAALLGAGSPSPEAIDRFLSAAPFPLVGQGHAVFVWRGEADGVCLLRWIHAGIDRVPLARVPRTDLWLAQVDVANSARFEYKLAVQHHGHEEWVLDPRNPERARDPFGENSVCCTSGYVRPPWTTPQGAPEGRLIPFGVETAIFEGPREEALYLPPGHDPWAPYPLVVIHDGTDFMTYADLGVSLDNLIAAGDIPPVMVALVQTVDRMGEYPRGRRHARYVVRELIPAIEARYRVSDDPAERVLLGASLGAVASLATAFRFPGVFGGLVLQSGSFILDKQKLNSRPHPVFHRVADLVSSLKRAPSLPPTRAFVSTGEFEGLAEENRALAFWLAEHGVAVRFQSSWDGHHWHNWRDQLRDGLMWVLSPSHSTR